MPDLYLLCHATELHKSTNTGQLLPGLRLTDETSASGLAQQTLLQPQGNEAVAGEPYWQSYQICWQRKTPDPQLMTALQRGGAVLLYPSAHARLIDLDCPLALQSEATQPLHSVIVLDATWQLAQKMFNQSPYLHALPHWCAQSQYQSAFKLRRNQRAGAWCTAETVALLWQASGALQQAEELWRRFRLFNQR